MDKMDLKSFEDLKEKESLEYKITLAEDRSDDHLKLSHTANEKLAPMLKMMDEMAQALEQSRKRFSHIEDWHRDNVTPDNFEDCQEVGQTPENYLRDGKINCDKKLESYKTFKKEYGLDEKK